MEGYHQKILVLGDMLELGDSAETLHKQMAKAIDPNEIDFVVTYGILASAIAKEAKQMMGKTKWCLLIQNRKSSNLLIKS